MRKRIDDRKDILDSVARAFAILNIVLESHGLSSGALKRTLSAEITNSTSKENKTATKFLGDLISAIDNYNKLIQDKNKGDTQKDVRLLALVPRCASKHPTINDNPDDPET